VDGQEWLAKRFEAHRSRLRAMAYRMLGSLSGADDAIQEAWLRLAGSDATGIRNLGGWLTTVVARICLDMLQVRESRREWPLPDLPVEPGGTTASGVDPAEEAMLADSVGVALLVVLDTLTPAERLAFVLHDIFGVPFGQIALIVGRSPSAAKMLASRARRRVRSGAPLDQDLRRQRRVIAAFLAAARQGEFEALLEVLDPAASVRADAATAPAGMPVLYVGARAVARQALLFSARARYAQPAVVDGAAALMAGPPGPPTVMTFAIARGKILRIEVIADPARLRTLRVEGADTSKPVGTDVADGGTPHHSATNRPTSRPPDHSANRGRSRTFRRSRGWEGRRRAARGVRLWRRSVDQAARHNPPARYSLICRVGLLVSQGRACPAGARLVALCPRPVRTYLPVDGVRADDGRRRARGKARLRQRLLLGQNGEATSSARVGPRGEYALHRTRPLGPPADGPSRPSLASQCYGERRELRAPAAV
jgi:RNA polymerase sigma factor (sigma-70 family)